MGNHAKPQLLYREVVALASGCCPGATTRTVVEVST